MKIEFIYRYVWSGEDRAYHVAYDTGVTTVRVFVDGEIGSVVSSIPAGRLAEIDAHIAANLAANSEGI